jgi:gluconate 2-dehydrogenase
VSKDIVEGLREHFDVTEFAGIDDGNRRAFIEALGTAHGIMGNMLKVTTDLLEAAPSLEVASTISAGYDAFDVGELTRRGIVLTNTPDEVTETTADLAFALMLASARRVVELGNWARSGAWVGNVDERFFGVDVHGKTLGIVGLGRIGGALARRAAHGFGMRVLYTNRKPNAQAESAYGAVRCPLDELLVQSDFVCAMVPLSSETHHLIGAREFALMKQSAILINASRGAVIDEQALIDALQAGQIRGAGLDVFEREPLESESALWDLENVILTPHVSGGFKNYNGVCCELFATNLRRFRAGQPLFNLVDRSMGY